VDFGFARRAQEFDFQNPQNLSEKKKKKKGRQRAKAVDKFCVKFSG